MKGTRLPLRNIKYPARAFFVQSEAKCELALKWIRKQIRFRMEENRIAWILVKDSTIESFLKTVEDRVYNPEYLRDWIARELAQTKRGQERVSLCARWAGEARKTRVETLRTIMFSEWFRKVAGAALPPKVVREFEASVPPQADKRERSRLFVEFLCRINPTHGKGRDLEEKVPHRSKCDQGHLQYGNDPRGLATPEGFAGGGDPEGIATPMGTTTGIAQGILGTLDRKVQRHRARIEKDRDAC